jgi:ankyrin repeat protein
MIETLVGYARDGNFDEFRKLLYREPDLLEQTTESGESPLIAALYNGRMEIVDYLLEKGITVTIHEAAALGDDQSVRWLLDYEPLLIGGYSFDGWTPLHLAAFFGATEAVSLLIERGAQIDAVS